MNAVSSSPSTHASVLVVEPDADTRHNYVELLNAGFAVTAVDSGSAGVAHLALTPPTLLITDVAAPDGDSLHLCRLAKSLSKAPTVLMTTSDVQCVPDAIEAGCDSILLKPFARNLLVARVNRLARDYHQTFVMRCAVKPAHEPSQWSTYGTNQFCPSTPCFHCGHLGVTSFDYTARRQSWYACLACKSVWAGSRPPEW